MAHFAQLDETNTVLQVIVVHNNELVASKQTMMNEDGTVAVSIIESEDKGVSFCQSLYGADTRWIQTSYNGSFRGKYAAIGDVYDADVNEFYTPVVADSPDVPVVAPAIETEQAVVLETQEIIALTSQQISGLE